MNQEKIMQQLQIAAQAYQSKDLDGAEAIFKQILAVNPKEPNSLHLLGCIYKDRGQLQKAVELIQGSIREDGSNPIPFLNLGKFLAIAGQYENAAGVFQESLKRNQQISETWFCFGNALKEIEKIEEAKQAYRNAFQLNPAHAGAASNLGALLTDDGELEEAEQLFSAAVGQAPNDVNLRINYGKLLSEKDEHAAAIVQYQLALPFAPQSPELHYNLANALKEEGEVEGAIASYRKAVEVKSDFAEAYLNLGNVLNAKGSVNEAMANYRTAIKVIPDCADAYVQLADVLKEEGQIQSAVSCLRSAMQIESDHSGALRRLATLLHEENQVDEALDLFLLVLGSGDDCDASWFHLSRAGLIDSFECFRVLKGEIGLLYEKSFDLVSEDLCHMNSVGAFCEQFAPGIGLPELSIEGRSFNNLLPKYSACLVDLFDAYFRCRQFSLPRWLVFSEHPMALLAASDYLEALRVAGDTPQDVWSLYKELQLSLAYAKSEVLPSQDHLFVKKDGSDELLWLRAEHFQFPDMTAALSLRDSLLKKTHLPSASSRDRSEFFRKAHLLDAQKFYMAAEILPYQGEQFPHQISSSRGK